MSQMLKLTKSILAGIAQKYLGQEVVRPIDRAILHSSDLTFSSLSDMGALKPLSGYQVITIDDLPVKFLPEGFQATFQIFHNDAGDATILLNSTELIIDEFWPETDIDIFYQREGKRIIGAGPSAHDYEVEFEGTEVYPAERVIGPKETRRARDTNFFSTEPSDPIEFKKGGSPAQICVFARAKRKGIYTLSFKFIYNIAGIQKSYISDKIYVVKGR
jgi:hypothetical protein